MSGPTHSAFARTVLACLVALALWNLGIWAWRTMGSYAAVLGFVVAAGLGLALAGLKHWIDGRRGLDQWPDPHGRYYDEWLSLPSGTGDYYEWLAQKMGNKEPWRTWAERDRNQE